MTTTEQLRQNWENQLSSYESGFLELKGSLEESTPVGILTNLSALLHSLQNWQELHSQHTPDSLFVELKIPSQSPLHWFPLLETARGFFWSDREHQNWTLGVGFLREFFSSTWDSLDSLFSSAQEALHTLPTNTHCFGGLSFQHQLSSQTHWEGWPGIAFVIPAFSIEHKLGQTRIRLLWQNVPPTASSVNVLRASIELLQSCLASLEKKTTPAFPVQIADEAVSPTQEGWSLAIEQAGQAFASDTIHKIVLARESQWTVETPLSLQSMLAELWEHAPDTFVFSFRLQTSQPVFLGATPERLYKREARQLWTEALAGTRRRGNTPEEDKALGDDLLHNSKDLHEQGLVFQELQEQLLELCTSVASENTPQLKKLHHLQHLYTPMEGKLRSKVSDTELLQTLHPTPAVGGRPRDKALALLAEIEPIQRGWYAAPIGTFSLSDAEWAVGIRSALWATPTLYVYTGAGIVEDSIATLEWEELEHKLGTFARFVRREE